MFHAHQSEFAELGWMGMFEAGGRREPRPSRSRRRRAVWSALCRWLLARCRIVR
jgi:hypothetical protein